MRLLVDTHIVLWLIEGDLRLSQQARNLIEAVENDIFISVASLWEMAIKISLGKLPTPGGHSMVELAQHLGTLGFQFLPIQAKHLDELKLLDWHHRDPFDRLMIAQAIVESLTLVTDDQLIPQYPLKVVK